MRLHLDPALSGNGVTGPAETGQPVPAAGSGADSLRITGDLTGGDSIQISGPSSALNQLSADRNGRVQQLTALVLGGSYQVSATQVGRAIVADAVSGGDSEE